MNLSSTGRHVAHKNKRFGLHPRLQLAKLGALKEHQLALLEASRQTWHHAIIIALRPTILPLERSGHLLAGVLKERHQLLRQVRLRAQLRVEIEWEGRVRLREPGQHGLLLIQ